MTNCEYTRARNNAEQTRFLEINAAVLGPQAAKHGDTSLNLASGLSHQFGKGALPCAVSKAPRHISLARATSPCTPIRSKKISTDSRSAGFERVTQSVMRAHQVAIEPRHCGFLAITPPLQ